MRHKVCASVFERYYVALGAEKTGELGKTRVAPTIPEALNLNTNAEYVAIVRVGGTPTDVEDNPPNRSRTYPTVTVVRVEPWTKKHSVKSAIIAAEDAYPSASAKEKAAFRSAIDEAIDDAKAWVADPTEANRAAAVAAAEAEAAAARAATEAAAEAAWSGAGSSARDAARAAARAAAYARINGKIVREVYGR